MFNGEIRNRNVFMKLSDFWPHCLSSPAPASALHKALVTFRAAQTIRSLFKQRNVYPTLKVLVEHPQRRKLGKQVGYEQEKGPDYRR